MEHLYFAKLTSLPKFGFSPGHCCGVYWCIPAAASRGGALGCAGSIQLRWEHPAVLGASGHAQPLCFGHPSGRLGPEGAGGRHVMGLLSLPVTSPRDELCGEARL